MVGATAGLAGCGSLGNTDTAAFHDGDWHSYGNGPENRNRVAAGAPKPADVSRMVPTGWAYAPPAVHDDVVYFAAEKRVTASGLDGVEIWTERLDGEAFGIPALDPDRGRLYVPMRGAGSTDVDPEPASVAAFAITDGERLATYRVGDEATYGVSVVDGDVYARSATTCVRFGPDGTERWRRSLDPLVYDEYNLGDSTATQIPPTVTDDAVYVPDRDALVKLDRESGDDRWRVSVDTPYAAAVADGRGVVQTAHQEVVAVDHAGEERWRRDLHSRAAAALAGDDIYVNASDVHELDATSGETTWQAHIPSEGTAAPVATDDTVIVAGSGVRAFRRAADGLFAPDRLRWEAESSTATPYASPVVAAGRLFAVGTFGLEVLTPKEP